METRLAAWSRDTASHRPLATLTKAPATCGQNIQHCCFLWWLQRA